MRDFHISFHRWADAGPVPLAEAEPPDEPGAYILGTADGTMLVYPWATSPVFYIGKATSLSQRLGSHRHETEQARADFWTKWVLPRHQYGAAFGADAAWFLAKDGEDPGALEANLINSFYMRYGSIPVANSSWPNIPAGDDG